MRGKYCYCAPVSIAATAPSQGYLVHNLRGARSHPDHSTCFDGSEIRVPSGYTKGRHLRMTAFSRSIASSGNHFKHRLVSRSLRLAPSRDVPVARPRRCSRPISPETLGSLCVSPRLG